MYESIKHQLNILKQEHITPNELFIIRALRLAQEERNPTYIKEYLEIPEKIRGDFRQVLLKLQNRGIILKTGFKIPEPGENLDIYSIPFNMNFIKRLHKASYDMGQELFEVYPDFAIINGSMVGIKTVSKKYDSLEDAFIAYGKAVGYNPQKHKEVIELTKWGKENNLINCSLASFIIDRRWEALRKLKDGDGANVNYNSIKLI